MSVAMWPMHATGSHGIAQRQRRIRLISSLPIRPGEVRLGKFFEVSDADKLSEIYSGLGTRLSSKEVKEEVTVAFAGGALVLLLAGGALSMAWFGRPV